ncbi:MAG TPA: 30S ribosomal protein S6 [Acidimicrobiales bacterium]|nr:30S ribosomal protein S6 [Acidimicrobiales bacterium]
MRPYEVMVIFDAGLEDDVIRAYVDRITELVTTKGGVPGPVEHWGKRRFAYELRHRWEGYYALLSAEAEPAVMAEVHRMLSLADEVIRHKIVRIPDAVVASRARPAPVAVAAGEQTDEPGQESEGELKR